jgi:hypothetical protein
MYSFDLFCIQTCLGFMECKQIQIQIQAVACLNNI